MIDQETLIKIGRLRTHFNLQKAAANVLANGKIGSRYTNAVTIECNHLLRIMLLYWIFLLYFAQLNSSLYFQCSDTFCMSQRITC